MIEGPATIHSVGRDRPGVACSFCKRLRIVCRSMVERGNVRVCGVCADQMRAAIEDDGPETEPAIAAPTDEYASALVAKQIDETAPVGFGWDSDPGCA